MIAKSDLNALHDVQRVKILDNVLKTNISVCSSVGSGFISQLNNIYASILLLYGSLGVMINEQVTELGIHVETQSVLLKVLNTLFICIS